MTWEVSGIISSVIVSLATLIFAAVQVRRGAKKDLLEELDLRLEKLEKAVRDCEEDRARLLKDNFALLTELHELRGAGPAS